MKLLRLSIENFGKLSNLSMEFSDGINVINEANAWGKSTLAAFLKAMFYGLDAKKEAGAFEKERNLYRPWQGGSFGGELDFEVNGKQYRISRSFGRTEKTDEFHLYDLSTNLESDDYSEAIGLELFDLDSASFKRSIYIAQNDCVSETSDHINAKLGNLADNTDDINNFESASLRLKELLNQLTPERVTGSIKKRKNYITQLTQELHGYEAAEAGLAGILQKEHLVSAQLQELLDIRKNYAQALVVASEESRKRELRLQYDALCKEEDEKKKKKDVLESFFPKGVPSDVEFQTQMHTARQMEAAHTTVRSMELTLEELEELSKLEAMFDHKVPTDSDIDAALQMFGEIDKQKEEIARQESRLSMFHAMMEDVPEEPKFEGAVGYKVLLFMGIGVALIGGAALFAWYSDMLPMMNANMLIMAALVALNCGGVLALIGAVMGIRIQKRRTDWHECLETERMSMEEKQGALDETVTAMKEDVREVYATIGKFLGNYHVYGEVGEYQSRLYELKNQLYEYERLTEKAAQCQAKKDAYHSLRANVLSFVELYGFQFEDEFSLRLNELENKAVEYKSAMYTYQEAVKKKEDFERRQDKSFWTRETMCPYSLEELNQMIAQADSKLEELKNAKAQYAKQLEDLQEQLDLRDEKKAELEELVEMQERDTNRYHIVRLTQEFLTRAKEQFTAKYMQPISKGFSKYYSMLTGKVEDNWVIDANIHLKVHEQGELRDVKWLSAGYRDLIGVCMRLALVDTMYHEEKPFLILDDPFVNLDREKVAHGNKLLLSVAEEYQVIYFTCHDCRSPVESLT